MEYPEEVRERARELRGRGLSIREIARELAGPSRMAVWRWISGAHDGPGARVKPAKRRRRMELPEVVGDGPIYPDIDPEDKDAIIDRLMLENAILRGIVTMHSSVVSTLTEPAYSPSHKTECITIASLLFNPRYVGAYSEYLPNILSAAFISSAPLFAQSAISIYIFLSFFLRRGITFSKNFSYISWK